MDLKLIVLNLGLAMFYKNMWFAAKLRGLSSLRCQLSSAPQCMLIIYKIFNVGEIIIAKFKSS